MRMDDDRIVGYERIFNTLCGRERELFNALKAERKESKKLQAKLEHYKIYMAHKRMCNVNMTNQADQECDCGLTDLLKGEK